MVRNVMDRTFVIVKFSLVSLRATPRCTISQIWLSYTVACWVFFPSLRSVDYSMARATGLLSVRSAGSLIHGYSGSHLLS